jgi:VanZ family protein
MKLSNPKKFYKYAFIIWGILILTVSSIPDLAIPIPEHLSPDKIAHFLEYFIFSSLFSLYLFFSNKKHQKIIILTLTLIAFAYLDELHQKLIPGRQYSLFDFSADFFGIICGWSILYFMKKK